MFSVDLLEHSTYHLRAFGVPPGSPMTGSLLESTCSTSELQPVCFDDVANEKCFSPDTNLIDLLANSTCGSTNYWSDSKCHSSLQYVFAYKGEGDQVGQGLKAENNTLGGVNWVKNSQTQGSTGKAVFALCAYIVPPTTTTTTTTTTTVITTTTRTTTTTTTTPSSISHDEMEEFLSPTFDCPLEQSEENGETGATTATKTLPAIDLLLNPKRKTELDQLQRWVEENAENVTLTEVLFFTHI